MIVGMSGISGAGKSTLMRRLESSLQATCLFWDEYDEISQGPEDYVKWYEESKNYADWKYDALADTLKRLKAGDATVCPATKRTLQPTKHILFDAPLGRCHQATGQYIDFLVCIDTPLDIALARRLIRDYKNHLEPAKILEELEYYLEHSRPLYILAPAVKQASDLIIDGSLTVEEQERQVLEALQVLKAREM
jgi:uridine kinase